MALVTLGQLMRYPGILPAGSGTPAFATDQTLDAAGEYVSYIFQAREAMTISHVGWRTGTVAGSPTADTRIETVDAAGLPTGTLWAANTNIVSGTLTSTTWTLHALTASASIAKGDFFALKVVYASGTSIIVQQTSAMAQVNTTIPYRVTNTSGSAVKSALSTVSISVAFGSSATTFYVMEKTFPISTLTNSAFSNSVAGSKRGLRFQVPMACRCAGLVWYDGSSVGDFNAMMLDDAGNELSGSSTAFEGDRIGNSITGSVPALFDNAVTLAKATWYRAVVEPSSATNITVGFATLPDLNYRSAWPGGTNQNYTTFTTAGGWIDTATDSVPWMDILIDQIDDGTGSGSAGMLYIPNMDGT